MALHSEHRRRLAALIALAITLTACSGEPSPATGPPAGEPAVDDASPSSSSPATDGETAPSGPTGSETVGPGGGLLQAVDLCEELDAAVLSRIAGLRLHAGMFDGANCTWVDRNERGTLTMSLGRAQGSTAAYIEEVKSLDIGAEATVAGADGAAAVTITSGAGASRSTRVALVAKVGRDRLTVVLTSRDSSLDAVTAIAELVTNR